MFILNDSIRLVISPFVTPLLPVEFFSPITHVVLRALPFLIMTLE